MNQLQDFINNALCQPPDYLSYYVSRKLAEMYPDRAVIESEIGAFNLSEFAKAGKCSFVRVLAVHQQETTFWRSNSEEDLHRDIENAWVNVLWSDGTHEHLFDVLLLSFNEGGCRVRRFWILGDSPALAEAFLKATCAWCDEVHGEILVFEDGYWRKDKQLAEAIRHTTFDNLILPPELVDELRADFDRFLNSRAVYERYGIPWKRGVLLIGPPGNGKTHTIKALVNELHLPCLYVKSIKGGYISEQNNLRHVFERARAAAPCLIVMEDLDSLVDDNNRSFFLNELDGFASNTGVIVIATTNYPERLDPAILDRPSRFDRKYYFDLPGLVEREGYLRVWNSSLQPELTIGESDLFYIARETEGFSFAYLKELFLSAMMQWMGEQTSGAMGRVMRERLTVLREQMAGPPDHGTLNAEPPLDTLMAQSQTTGRFS